MRLAIALLAMIVFTPHIRQPLVSHHHASPHKQKMSLPPHRK